MATVVPDRLNSSWLDEELRKEKAVVAELRDLVDKQQVMLADQAQRIMTLEDRLAKLQTQLTRVANVEQATQHTRNELVLRMSELRQEVQKRQTEFLRNRQAEREHDVRAVQEIEAELARFDALEQAMAVRQAEDQRLNEALLRMQPPIDDLDKRLGRAEETARQLAGRIQHQEVTVGQLALGLDKVNTATQEQQAAMLLLQDTQTKLGQGIAELQTMRQEITNQQDELLEQQRRADHRRAQAMTEWGRKLEGYAHQLEGWTDQLRFYGDQHEKNRRVVREIQELARDVSQQQDRLRQLQRIAEEQLRREIREWQSENDKRWAQESKRRDASLEAQVTREEAQEDRLTQLEQNRERDLTQVGALDERQVSWHEATLGELERLRAALLHLTEVQLNDTRKRYAELGGLLGEKVES